MTPKGNVMANPARSWNTISLEKALAFELCKRLLAILAKYYSFLTPHLQIIMDRLQPVRLSHGGRHLRAWGRGYDVSAEEAWAVKLLVEHYHRGTRVVELLPLSFVNHAALADGVIATDEHGGYWLEEPAEEKDKPVLVTFPGEDAPRPISERFTKEGLAIAALFDDPARCDDVIAELADCHPNSLYRMKKFQAAKEMLQGGRLES